MVHSCKNWAIPVFERLFEPKHIKSIKYMCLVWCTDLTGLLLSLLYSSDQLFSSDSKPNRISSHFIKSTFSLVTVSPSQWIEWHFPFSCFHLHLNSVFFTINNNWINRNYCFNRFRTFCVGCDCWKRSYVLKCCRTTLYFTMFIVFTIREFHQKSVFLTISPCVSGW